MPWKESDRMSLRKEFVMFASQKIENMSQLCKSFKVSRKTGYKWLNRFRLGNANGLCDRSRKPHHSPFRTPSSIESLILQVRDNNPAWGGRTIRGHLQLKGYTDLPAPSTITRVLYRHNRIDTSESDKHKPWSRFERDTPNALWQMDFKGHFPTGSGRCHPLTILDDHSRFCLCLQACERELAILVKSHLTDTFRKYGLPDQMNVDNGPPWGCAGKLRTELTSLVLWLIRLGIQISFSRPHHPQTNGKIERFHRTLKVELLQSRYFKDFDQIQRAFDQWRQAYNTERPNQAIQMKVPINRYQPSIREYPEQLPPIEYDQTDILKKVDGRACISFMAKRYFVGKGFRGNLVAIRPTTHDGLFEMFYCRQKIMTINVKEQKMVKSFPPPPEEGEGE